MKKIVTLFAAICCAVMMFGQSYGILVNGNTYFAGEPAGQFEGFTQYLAHVQVNAGDYCQIYDATYEASWVVTLNTSSVSGFTLNSDRYDVTVSGCYDFYIKIKYQQDELYIGNGSDCGSGTPIGGETQDTVPEVVTVSSVPSQATDVMLQAFYWDSYTDHGYGDTRWNTLLSQSEEISSYFDLVWLPPASFSTGGTGYIPRQYSNLSSDWGTANELYQLLDALHDGNSRVVADIVINHCGNYSSSCNFYPLNFGTYGSFSPDNTWITTDDEGGCTGGSHADVGYDGEQNYGSARDWDHQNPNVQAMCRAYLQWMKEQGFDGWRYDYGKGYTHDHINDYNTAAGAYFSVVEYWDGNAANLQARLNDAGWNTTLFDFSTKYNALNDGISAGNYAKCQGAGLPGAGKSKYAVTFVDNHDTFTRSSSEFGGQNNSMTAGMKDRLLQANAFILSMPGIPCVFYPHWVTYKAELKKMIEARHMTGVHSESTVYDEQVEQGGYQATIAGKNGFIVLQLGNKAAGTIANCTKYAYGNGYAIWVHTNDGSVDPEEPETPDTYYIKNNWNGGEWNWEQMTANADSTAWTYTGVFGGTGVNVSTTPQEGALWFATADFLYTVEGYEAQEGDTIQFVFNPAATTVTAILIGHPAVEPQPETPRFRLTGNEAFVGEGREAWELDDAFESYSDTMTLNLPAGNFEMQLINSVGDWKGYDALTQPITAGITTNQWGNVCFYMAEPGQITVIYNGSDFFVLGTFAQPERHFYLIGAINGWDVETAMEFEDRDSLYALSLEELSGEFKILTARDWEQLSYGAPLDQSSLVSLGVPFQMQEWDAANMVANGVFTNVTVELRLNAGIATITVVQNGTSGGDEPQDTTSVDPVVEHYYLVGQYNGWDVETAQEFTYQDSIYTITVENFEGEFKVIDARDWAHGIYGAENYGDIINLGGNYPMVAANSYNMLVDGNYTNATFNLTKSGNDVTLYFVDATPVQQDTTEIPEQQCLTVYTVLPEGWDYLMAYVWGTNMSYHNWPGEGMMHTGEYFRGQPVYAFIFPDYCNKIIFHNGNGIQTPDLSIDPTKLYYYAETWFESWDAVPEEVIVIPAKYYLTGNMDLVVDAGVSAEETWVANAIKCMSDTTILNLYAGKTYSMALTLNGVWSEGDVKIFEDLTENTPGVVADRAGYISFTLAENGPVTIIYNDSVFTVQGNFIIPEVVEDITVYTVLPEDWNDLMAYVWFNNTGFVQWPGEYMTPTADTFRGQPVYSYTFPETYTNIIFHNGNGVQTPDIVLDATKRYYYGNTWYASWDSVPEEVIVLPAKYYITGNESLMAATGLSSEYAWDAAAIPATSDTTELYLYAGIEYQVSVNLYGTWARGVFYYNYLTDITPGLTSSSDGFIAFTPAVDGNVTFILNDSVFTILGDFIVRAKETYYIKNNWNADEWTWNQMEAANADSTVWTYTGVFGGTGVNINIAADDEGAAWYPTEDFILNEGGLYPQEMDTVYFVYSVLWRTLEAYVIGRPDTTITPEPQPEERHFYLIGEFNGWNTETAPEFAAMDTFYTITIDTLHGTYKVIGARDWMHGDYGAYAMNDELTIGEPYIMWPAGYNLYTSTTYLNAVLEIRVVGDDVLLTLVSGTPYEVPQEDRHFYLIGNFNDWSTETAPEFALIDSQYVITLDTLAGAFKVIGARDWAHGDYGAYGYGDVINVGGKYNMNAVSSYDLNLNGTYADVTLTLTVTDNVVTLHFVAGTRVDEPATDLDEIRTDSSMYKTIENGALYIYRNGVKYNAAGQIVR